MSIKPDFAYVYTKANEILLTSSVIQGFPYSLVDLIKKKSDIRTVTFGEARRRGLRVEDFGSDSACLIRCNGRELIFYNEEHSAARSRFDLAHEFGHYICEHDLSTLDPELYGVYEVEANYFSAQILMPQQVIMEMRRRGARISAPFIMNTFGTSADAAQKRLETLSKTDLRWYRREEKEFDDIILKKYQPFIDEVCPPRDYAFLYDDEELRQRERDRWY